MKAYLLLASFTYQYEYSVITGLFREEGIRYFLKNETLAGIFPVYSNALGGIHLLIHPKDFKRAKKIFDKLNEEKSPLRIV